MSGGETGLQGKLKKFSKKLSKYGLGAAQEANQLYKQDSGFSPYPGQYFTDPSNATLQAWRQMSGLASENNPLGGASVDATLGLLGGTNHLLDKTQNKYQNLYGDADAYARNAIGNQKGLLGDIRGNTKEALGAYGDLSNLYGDLGSQGANEYSRLMRKTGNRADQSAGAYENLIGNYGQFGQNNVANLRGIARDLQDYGTGATGDLRGLYNQVGQQGGSSVVDLQKLLGQSGNDAFQKALDIQLGNVGDTIQRGFGGSSYGGADNQTILGRTLGDVATTAMANNWNQNIANQRGLLGDIANVQAGTAGQQQGLLGDISGINQSVLAGRQGLQGDIANLQGNVLGAQSGLRSAIENTRANELSGLQGLQGARENLGQNIYGAQSGLAGAMENTRNNALSGEQNIYNTIGNLKQGQLQNQLGIAGALGGLGQTSFQNQIAGINAAPGAYQQLYAPADRLAQVGSLRDQQKLAELQGGMNRFNANDMQKWNRLGALSGVLSGQANTLGGALQYPQAYGTGQSNPFGGALGGALLGAQAFGGPLGTLGGGALGLLSGL